MAQLLTDADKRAEAGLIVTKAFLRALDMLDIPSEVASSLLQTSSEALHPSGPRSFALEPGTPQFERAVLFIRFFRALDSIYGGDIELMKTWLHGYNRALHDVPLNLLSSLRGLKDVIAYLDSRRAPL